MITTPIKREFTVNYSIDQVKAAIANCSQLQGYMLNSNNDMIVTYQFGLAKGIWTGKMNKSLSEVGDL